jgi:ribosome maturation protein SDO1
MVSLDKSVIARIHKGGDVFEVLVDPEKALDFKKGRAGSIESILVIQEVFTDSKKGERASSKDLEKHFSTSDKLKIAEEIIRHGDIQLTTEQKRKMTEEKYKEIADVVSRQGIDPKTNLPHPPQRIMNAMEQAHVNVDPFRPASMQVKDVVEKIQEILPIRFERLEIAVRVPVQFAGKAGFAIRKLTNVKREEWQTAYWVALMEIPAGMQGEIYSKLNELTSGQCEVKVVKKLS